MKINPFITEASEPFRLKCTNHCAVPFVTLQAEALWLLSWACAVCVVAD